MRLILRGCPKRVASFFTRKDPETYPPTESGDEYAQTDPAGDAVRCAEPDKVSILRRAISVRPLTE